MPGTGNSNEAHGGIMGDRRSAAMAPVPARELVSEAGDKATSLKLPHMAALGRHSARRRSTSIIEISLRPDWSGERAQGQSRSPGLQWVSRRQGGEDGAIRDGLHRLHLKCFVLNCLAHSRTLPPYPIHQQTSKIPQ